MMGKDIEKLQDLINSLEIMKKKENEKNSTQATESTTSNDLLEENTVNTKIVNTNIIN